MNNTNKIIYHLFFAALLTLCISCEEEVFEDISEDILEVVEDTSMVVTATAYNSVERQTKKGNPFLAAWGDVLEPGERAIAVSRDLIGLGLDHNEEVEIVGLPGTYIVKDKMNKRWRKKIDIYMGMDENAAIDWGKKEVTIIFNPKNKVGKFDKQLISNLKATVSEARE